MDRQLLEKLQRLQLYLVNLPHNLPVPSASTSKFDFRNFAPDDEWVEDAGEEAAVNRELEVQFGSRHMGPIMPKERSPGVVVVADVLKRYLQQFPRSAILEKWVDDITTAAELAFKGADIQLS